MSFFEQEPRRRLHQALTRAELRMGKWLLGQGSLMLILGVASTIVFAALHIRYAYALGVLMGLFNIVPVAGALISMSLVILVAALDSWGHVLGVIIFYAIYVQVENAFLTPRIMRSSVDLPGIAVMVALLIGSATAGIVGAMISVPTAVLVAVLLDEYLAKTPKVTLVTDEPVEEVVVHPSGESRPLATPVAHR
jgi:predicted PurR-regulated permease PerM